MSHIDLYFPPPQDLPTARSMANAYLFVANLTKAKPLLLLLPCSTGMKMSTICPALQNIASSSAFETVSGSLETKMEKDFFLSLWSCFGRSSLLQFSWPLFLLSDLKTSAQDFLDIDSPASSSSHHLLLYVFSSCLVAIVPLFAIASFITFSLTKLQSTWTDLQLSGSFIYMVEPSVPSYHVQIG